MRELGLEYRFVASYLKKELTMKDLTEVLSAKIWQYARRQKTWFKKDKRIHWHAPEDFEKICTEVSHFLLKRELWQKD
ncbi:MAG: tRNA dimethylallyltransferase [Candidatus Parcubacteria bacterium]|nr:tRNA dimethylallyltransferase [Candidatus Parcubacteria bacterium]